MNLWPLLIGVVTSLEYVHSQSGTYSYENDGVSLAIDPLCGSLEATIPPEINVGIHWDKIKTIVIFGDSFTHVGNRGDGSPPPPVTFSGKRVDAAGRVTNGWTWIEHLATPNDEAPRKLLSYCIPGAVTDRTIWHSRIRNDDFPLQVERFLTQNLTLDPKTTLYAGYFGINDYYSIAADGNNMVQAGNAASRLLDQLRERVGAKNFLWIGVQFNIPPTKAYQRAVWMGLKRLHIKHGSNIAFVDSARFFGTIDEDFPRFGYTSSNHCVEGRNSSIEDECEDPKRTVYYIGGHPSKQTHKILAEYVRKVLTQCEFNIYIPLAQQQQTRNHYLLLVVVSIACLVFLTHRSALSKGFRPLR